ncbi:MAG TPA: ABC transporter ATP-binding protein/permease [Xanthobacteraceae bacterium]|nr:ABC transporter ATP-binding protein/permease [Xanthobacteraceae bacterium]
MDGASNSRAHEEIRRKYLLKRFWASALGFWRRFSTKILTLGLIVIVVLQVLVQYEINLWNRSIFDALQEKSAANVLHQALLFVPLAASSITLAVLVIYGRTTTQRKWRRWLTEDVINRWLANGRYFHLNLVKGDHDNPEYRIAEDIRISTEAPIDFSVGLLSALLSAVTFIGVLWSVGGGISFPLFGVSITIPGYLVLAAILYAGFASGSMVVIGRRYVQASETKSQKEAEFRYALTRLRENGESIALIAGEEEEKSSLSEKLASVLNSWKNINRQYGRTTIVAQMSFLIAPVFPVILSAPKFLIGTMTLGEVMQAASAFVTVQTAFNWLVDNYPKFADWTASARRVSSLMVSLDALETAEQEKGWGRIETGDAHPGIAMELHDVSVTLDDGTVVVKEANVSIKPGERVLFEGESGSGKSTLVRAIAGLWPWGSGAIRIQPRAAMFLLPQKPYIPTGPLRRAVIYPKAADEVSDEEVKRALDAVGLKELADRINDDASWDQTLSGGEKQRVAFARLLIHKPDIIVMDEATSALDSASQEKLMSLIEAELPNTTIVSVGHRQELQQFHQRKIILEHRKGGARIVSDQNVIKASKPRRNLLRRILRRPYGDLPPVSLPERHPGDRLTGAE